MTTEWHKSSCPYCGFDCGLMVGIEEGRVVQVRSMEGRPANDGDMCALPANYPPILTHDDRLKRPMIRRGGELVYVGWEEAIACVASGFRGIVWLPGQLAGYLMIGLGRMVNYLTNAVGNIHSKQPEYKVGAVRITEAAHERRDGGP